MMGRAPQEGVSHGDTASDDIAVLTRQLAQLKEERDYLLVHSRNLEVELRRFAAEPARIRDLEQRLAEAEARLRRVSAVHMTKWLLLHPGAAGRGIYRRLKDGVVWLTVERYRRFRLKRRQSRA
jgi:hypothetical protein